MEFGIGLFLIQLIALLYVLRENNAFLPLLIGANWFAVNLVAKLLVEYPLIGVSSIGAITYSFMYLVIYLTLKHKSEKVALTGLNIGVFLMIFCSSIAIFSLLVYPNPSYNIEIANSYRNILNAHSIVFISSLFAILDRDWETNSENKHLQINQ